MAVFRIERTRDYTLSDERIEKAITQNGARLIILDPIQAYMGEKTDMNRANEVRPMFRRLADVAERTGCAVILIGHLNKAAGGQSAYRGLGSIDFRAAARSVLLIGRVKREPNVRVIVHDKSSLAPEGKPIAFCLDPETGFSWIGEYDIRVAHAVYLHRVNILRGASINPNSHKQFLSVWLSAMFLLSRHTQQLRWQQMPIYFLF